jgi:uncharacterized membrane protein YfcA
MTISLSSLVILTISTFCCSVIAGMMGVAGGVLFVGILASFVETIYVVPLYAVVMIVSAGSRSVLFHKHINWRIVFRYTMGLLPGALLGIYVFKLLPKDLIKLLMGVFILVTIFLPVTKKEAHLNIGIFFLVGLVAGFIGIFFGASGPFTSSFYIRQGIIKEALIATKATCTLLDHALKIFLFGLIGINVLAYGNIVLYLIMAVIPGVYVGKLLLNKISDKAFLVALKVLLCVLAVRIIVLQI